jgi:hypothetical protein
MDIRLSDLDRITSETLAPFGTVRVAEHACAVLGDGVADPSLSLPQAGLALGAALIGADPAAAVTLAKGLTLTSVLLTSVDAAEQVWLSAEEALVHPLLQTWVPATYGSAIGELLRAGAQWTQLAPEAPYFVRLGLSAFGVGRVGVTHELAFPQANAGQPLFATATYGADVPDPAFQRVAYLKSGAIIEIGCRLPTARRVAAVSELSGAALEAAALRAAGVSLH